MRTAGTGRWSWGAWAGRSRRRADLNVLRIPLPARLEGLSFDGDAEDALVAAEGEEGLAGWLEFPVHDGADDGDADAGAGVEAGGDKGEGEDGFEDIGVVLADKCGDASGVLNRFGDFDDLDVGTVDALEGEALWAGLFGGVSERVAGEAEDGDGHGGASADGG